MKSPASCPAWCENPQPHPHLDHWTRAEVGELVMFGWITEDATEIAIDIGDTAEAVLTLTQARELRAKLDTTLTRLGDLGPLEVTFPCGHRCCTLMADFAVWVSHHAVECRPDTGFRCRQHAEELRTHWWRGLGGEMRCGCTVDGVLEDHYRRVAL